MPLQHTYADAYLASRVTQAREDQAISDVADLGTLPAAWVSRLTILRVYIITCLEMMAGPEDTFSAKLSAYRKDYDAALLQARAAQAQVDAAAGTPRGGASFFSVDLQRS